MLSLVVIAVASLVATETGDLDTGERLALRVNEAGLAAHLVDAHVAAMTHTAPGLVRLPPLRRHPPRRHPHP